MLNRLDAAFQGANALIDMTYDTHGRPTGRSDGTAGAGGTTALTWDAAGRPASLAHDLSGTTRDLTLGFTYSPAGQVAGNTRSNPGSGPGQADAFAWTSHYTLNRAYTANGLNRYTAITGSTTPTYDGRGNLTSANGATYGYNSGNMLTSASGGATLSYDPMQRLYETVGGGVTTRMAYDGESLIAEYNASNTLLRRYVHGAGADVPLVWYEGASIRRQLHADHQGSIVAIGQAYAAPYAVNRYDEYGVPASTNLGRFQYTGQIWLPELGMYHYKGRIYSATLGRFLQTDPIGYEDQFNLYAYVGNDPVNATDPSGLCTTASAATTETPSTAICQSVGDLNLSGNGAKNIIGFEDVRASAYQIGNDVPTIGIGHTAGVELGDTMTSPEIQSAFRADVNMAEGIVENLVGDLPVSQQEFDALVDLAFNVGSGELSASNSPGLHSAIADGDYGAIGDNLRYTRGPDGPSRGLVERSNSRQNIFRNGDYRIGIRRYDGVLDRLRNR